MLLCGSLNKILAPGSSLGWIVPGALHERVLALKRSVAPAPPQLIQMAAAEFVGDGGLRRHLTRVRDHLAQSLATNARTAGLERPPAGGLLAWVPLRREVQPDVLTELMRRHGVVVAPGAIFSRSGAASSFVRVHAADPWPTRVARFLADAREFSQA